jgi:hypothetical protein
VVKIKECVGIFSFACFFRSVKPFHSVLKNSE